KLKLSLSAAPDRNDGTGSNMAGIGIVAGVRLDNGHFRDVTRDHITRLRDRACDNHINIGRNTAWRSRAVTWVAFPRAPTSRLILARGIGKTFETCGCRTAGQRILCRPLRAPK